MRATIMYKAADVRVETVPDAELIDATDAIIRISRACICGSDLWPYKLLEPVDGGRPMGHEAIGVMESLGSAVHRFRRGDLVVMPFAFSDGTLYKRPVREDDALIPSLLTLSDVMDTGHHAAITARVGRGKKVAVIGDGAEQNIILGHHPDRIALARDFGATDVVTERSEAAVAKVRKLTGRSGAIGRVGVPHYASIPASRSAFCGNISVGGGPAPVRAYIETLLPDILEGRIQPGRVFDLTIGLDDVPDGYRSMNQREALKIMIKP